MDAEEKPVSDAIAELRAEVAQHLDAARRTATPAARRRSLEHTRLLLEELHLLEEVVRRAGRG